MCATNKTSNNNKKYRRHMKWPREYSFNNSYVFAIVEAPRENSRQHTAAYIGICDDECCMFQVIIIDAGAAAWHAYLSLARTLAQYATAPPVYTFRFLHRAYVRRCILLLHARWFAMTAHAWIAYIYLIAAPRSYMVVEMVTEQIYAFRFYYIK